MSAPPDEAFQSIRNAYRLLHDYHRRVVDTFRVARAGLDETLGVSLQHCSWERPPGFEARTDVLSRGPDTLFTIPTNLYVRLSSQEKAAPRSFTVELSYAGSEQGDIAPPRFEAFMKVIRAGASPRGPAVWRDMVASFDTEFDGLAWYDRKPHLATIAGIPVAYGGFAVAARDLGTVEAIRGALVEPLASMIRHARDR
jgi:hypothetical protein